jgi:alpha,alpha-trehalase
MPKNLSSLIDESPDAILGILFADMQKSKIYKDSKVFADFVPKFKSEQILKEYLLAKNDSHFNLRKFIADHFYNLKSLRPASRVKASWSPSEKIKRLWLELERNSLKDEGSLIALPYPYITPGGRFSEQYYWDSFFIMLGLAQDNRWDMVENMIKNITYMIDRFGFVPTANRTYYLSRSQPPFFSQMIKMLAQHVGKNIMSEYLPYLLIEYQFWMKGEEMLSQDAKAYAHIARMPDGTVLNRYYDSQVTPRPESFVSDTSATDGMNEIKASKLYQSLRAAAESGWDFSSRWFDDPHDIRTIRTADVVPIDLNCLLYQLEGIIADAYDLNDQLSLAKKFRNLSEVRAQALQKYCWDEKQSFFVDFDLQNGRKRTNLTLASIFPLYAKIATNEQAKKVALHLKNDFLKKGGLVTTLVNNGQQWDSPNGWAPLQWVAIEGLRNYGYNNLAKIIKNRWVKTNLNLLDKKGKLVEKYNVEDPGQLGGGGEYLLQDGFGWTNGVLEFLLHERK